MILDAQPFYVLSAQVRLYTVDADGNPLQRQWLGGTVDRIVLSDEFVERRIEYPGRMRARIYHEDERWAVTMENVRAVDLSGPVPRPTALRRNQEYALVIVWWDPTLRNVWLKRCYFGVKAQPANLRDPRNIDQLLKFSAEEMVEVAGTGAPDFSLLRTGQVYYIHGSERTQLYDFDPTTKAFTVVDPDSVGSRAEIDTSTPGQVSILIGGELALFGDGNSVQVRNLIAMGGSLLDDDPRIEFWVGSVRCASVSVDAFSAPNIFESADKPVNLERNIEFDSGAEWLMSITGTGTYAPVWEEIDL